MFSRFVLGFALVGLVFASGYWLADRLAPKPWKRFYNSYVSFAMPPDWDCQLEATAWVCRDTDDVLAKRSIMILTAKDVGPRDSLKIYEDHLSTPKEVFDFDGNSIGHSQVRLLENRKIGAVDWVVGIHFESEIQHYETRYFAGITKNVAILLTFSFHEIYTAEYEPVAEQVARSIQVTL